MNRRTFITDSSLTLGSLWLPGAAHGKRTSDEKTNAGDPCLNHAYQLLRQSKFARTVSLIIDPSLGSREAFKIESATTVTVTGGGPGGVLYGVQELLNHDSKAHTISLAERPDFEIRGTTYYLMKDGKYTWKLTREEFPPFYDRALLVKYLDYLFANRFNTIFIWTGHLFPSIMELPAYPDATNLSQEQLMRNQEQFRWFTSECARRNISVLLHFYNIMISEQLARSRGIPAKYAVPTPFVTEYMRYVLERFVKTFESVGLYVCPGEALSSQYQPKWLKEVILGAVKAAGRNPVVVIRYWALNQKGFETEVSGTYDNLFTELKHNVEAYASPFTDPRHAWIIQHVSKRHIINLHDVCDNRPFRVGSPLFIRETVEQWAKAGAMGAEVHTPITWRWPYTLDKLTPDQQGYWPPGPKLLTFERDRIWLAAFGRYLWRMDRDAGGEEAYWTRELAKDFGNEEAGRLMLRWHEVTGPILPGLQNLTAVFHSNWAPTATGSMQRPDDVLQMRWVDMQTMQQHTGPYGYLSQPVDSYFFGRYKAKYNQPGLTNRVSLPVSTYADLIAEGQDPPDQFMTHERILALLADLAEQSLDLARQAQKVAGKNQDEIQRYISDSQLLKLVVIDWQDRLAAAVEKRLSDKTGRAQHEKACIDHLQRAITNFEELTKLSDVTYLNATDLWIRLSWQEELQMRREDYLAYNTLFEMRRRPNTFWIEAETMEGRWPKGSFASTAAQVVGYSDQGFRFVPPTLPDPGALTKEIEIGRPGEYVVWTRGMLGGEFTGPSSIPSGGASRAFAVEVAGHQLPPTHSEPEDPVLKRAFVWRRAGVVHLGVGKNIVKVFNAGTEERKEGDGEAKADEPHPNIPCPDVILIIDDHNWRPEGLDRQAKYSNQTSDLKI